MPSTHLYLVQSPLQAMNAFEARRSKVESDAGDRHALVVFDQVSAESNRMVGSTLGELGWVPDLTLPCPTSGVGRIANWMRLRHFVRGLPNVQRVCLGAYDSGIMVAAANLWRNAEVVILDDGTGSLLFPAYRYEGTRGEYQKAGRRIAILGFDSELPRAVTCFSIYDLKLRSPDKLEPNTLGFLSDNVRYSEGGPVFFVGSVMPDAELVSFEDFYAWMEDVRGWFGDRDVHYFPHRRELMERKRPVLEKLGFKVVQAKIPFEMHLARVAEAPSAVASFYTTVFDTLVVSGLGRKGHLVAFDVPLSAITDPLERGMAQACYKNYERQGIVRVVRGYSSAPSHCISLAGRQSA